MPTTRKGCGCGERAVRVVRRLGVSEREMSDDYIRTHHARATAQALWRRLTRGRGA